MEATERPIIHGLYYSITRGAALNLGIAALKGKFIEYRKPIWTMESCVFGNTVENDYVLRHR